MSDRATIFSRRRPISLSTILVLRLVLERGDHQPNRKRMGKASRERALSATGKSSPDGPWVGGL